jgi:hypothetical protein
LEAPSSVPFRDIRVVPLVGYAAHERDHRLRTRPATYGKRRRRGYLHTDVAAHRLQVV